MVGGFGDVGSTKPDFEEPESCSNCGSREKMEIHSLSVDGKDGVPGWVCPDCGHAHFKPESYNDKLGADEQVSAELDRTLAMASQRFMPDIQNSLQGIPAVIQQAQQFLQQFQPPKPQDPTQVLMAETQRKAQADQQAAQVNQLKVQLEQQKNAREAQLDQIKMHENLAVEQAKIQMNTDDNTTAKELAVFEAEHGKHPHFTTGHGIMK